MAVDRQAQRGAREGAERAKRPRKRRRQQAPKTPAVAPSNPGATHGSAATPRAAPTGPDAAEMARRFVDQARVAWTVAAPHLGTVLSLAYRALAWLAGLLLRHRLVVFRTSHRAMWWGALAAMFVAGRALLSGTEVGPIVDDAHLWFAGGLGLCLVVLVFAAERRMRLAAFVLGAGHGAFGLVTWLITQA